jgi:hypothetical protein
VFGDPLLSAELPDMPTDYWPFAVIAVGLVSGMSSGAFGIGGGVVNKPLLRLLLQVSPGYVIGSPIPAQFLGAILGSTSYYRRGMINLRLVRQAAPFAIAGTVLGAYSTKLIKHSYLMVLLVLVVLWAGGRMMGKAMRRSEDECEESSPLLVRKTCPTAFVAGVLAGMLGLGGGFVLVPAFSFLLRREIKECIASSLAIVALTAIPNGITHWILGHIHWQLASLLLIGQLAGVWFGTVFTVRSSRRLLYIMFGLFLVIVSLALARLEILNLLGGL